jgi:phosphoglycolate phosphatase-like HAD superfamily hydrolase
MLRELVNPANLMDETMTFIRSHHHQIPMFIASGSEHDELNRLCKVLGIDAYFREIWGSPAPKEILVKNILQRNQIQTNSCLLIGDSINDFHAAEVNRIRFMGYGNDLIRTYTNFQLTF